MAVTCFVKLPTCRHAALVHLFPGISWKIARRCITWPGSRAQVKTWKLISCSFIPASSSKTLLLYLLPQGPINRASETFIKAFACYSIDVDAGTTLQSGAERHRRLKAAAIHRIASYSAVTSSVSVCTHKHTSCLIRETTSCCKADFSSSQTSWFLLLTAQSKTSRMWEVTNHKYKCCTQVEFSGISTRWFFWLY